MDHNKENAYSHMMNVFKMSWTWERLTAEERGLFIIAAEHATLRGSYSQRCEAMNDIYFAFLLGCGYSPLGWREPAEEVNA